MASYIRARRSANTSGVVGGMRRVRLVVGSTGALSNAAAHDVSMNLHQRGDYNHEDDGEDDDDDDDAS